MTEPQQPPAGWYPDPQDATQQRYWDGTTWTGHTAAGGASAAPVGDAAAGAGIPTAAAPAWSPMGVGAPTDEKKPLVKRKAFIIPVAIFGVLVVIGILAAVFGNGADHSNALEDAIKDDGQTQLQNSVDENVPGAKVQITDVSCVEEGSTQKYTCQIHMTLTSPDGDETVKLLQQATGSCDSKVSAHCLWHTEGEPTKDNS